MLRKDECWSIRLLLNWHVTCCDCGWFSLVIWPVRVVQWWPMITHAPMPSNCCRCRSYVLLMFIYLLFIFEWMDPFKLVYLKISRNHVCFCPPIFLPGGCKSFHGHNFLGQGLLAIAVAAWLVASNLADVVIVGFVVWKPRKGIG